MDIFIIGSGNVATSIGKAILKTEHNLCGLWSRNLKTGTKLAHKLDCEFIADKRAINNGYDLYIIAVNDDAVIEVAKSLPSTNGIVVHTSGSTPLLNIAINNGVIYPVETISSSRVVNFKKVPICIEASNDLSLEKIHIFTNSLSDKIYSIDTKHRATLHLSAVFANNFTNYILAIAKEILESKNLPKELLEQLIKTTTVNATKNNPVEIQTGPARRNDRRVIDQHLTYLNDYPEYQDVYKLLTTQLISLYQNESSNKEDS